MGDKAQKIWDYIENNQDTPAGQLAIELNLPKKIMLDLIFDWSANSKTSFDNKVKNLLQ